MRLRRLAVQTRTQMSAESGLLREPRGESSPQMVYFYRTAL